MDVIHANGSVCTRNPEITMLRLSSSFHNNKMFVPLFLYSNRYVQKSSQNLSISIINSIKCVELHKMKCLFFYANNIPLRSMKIKYTNDNPPELSNSKIVKVKNFKVVEITTNSFWSILKLNNRNGAPFNIRERKLNCSGIHANFPFENYPTSHNQPICKHKICRGH